MGISKSVVNPGVIGTATRGQNNSAYVYCDVFLAIFEVDCMGRAKFFTAFAFASNKIDALRRIDAIFKRNSLGILHKNRLAFAQTTVIGIGNFLGALFCTGTTGDTLFHIDVTRVLDQFDFKIARFTAKVLHFAERQYFDVDVPADLDQFW